MPLIEMIEQTVGSGALEQIGARVRMSPQQLRNVIGSLAPALSPKLAQHAATGGLDDTPFGDAAPPSGSDAADEHGRSILGSILGSMDASQSLAADASASTGVDVDRIKSLLPQLASIAAVTMAAKGSAGGGIGGALGGLLGSLGRS